MHPHMCRGAAQFDPEFFLMSLTITYRAAAVFALLGASFVAAPVMAKDCAPLSAGSSQIVFSGWAGPKLPVFVHKPQTAGADSRIVFVMHGVQRDGDRYRDEWRDLAEKHNLIVVVPTFGRKDFPTTGSYNLGNIVDEKGRKTPKAKWSFSAIEPLFDDIVCRVSGDQRGYALYGHSAGGQFVHRYVAFADAPRMEAAPAHQRGSRQTGPNAFRQGARFSGRGTQAGRRRQAAQLENRLRTGGWARQWPNGSVCYSPPFRRSCQRTIAASRR